MYLTGCFHCLFGGKIEANRKVLYSCAMQAICTELDPHRPVVSTDRKKANMTEPEDCAIRAGIR